MMISISTELLDREDLDLHAKMCCIYLVQAAQQPPEEPLSLDWLASRMGCSPRTVARALGQLKEKGLLIEEAPDSTEGQPEERHRIRKRDRQSPVATFKAFDAPARLSPAEQLKALRDFIREPVSDGTLRIILNTAGGDVERIRGAYQSAAASQLSDTLETLMHLLQQREGDSAAQAPETTAPRRPAAPAAQPPRIPQSPPPAAAEEAPLEPETRQVLTQINQRRIAELYTKSKKKG